MAHARGAPTERGRGPADEASRKRLVAGVFDRAAATYDAVGVDYFSTFGRRLVALAAPGPGARVLDVGCGRGACLWPAAEAVGPRGAVVGVDLSPAMVAATAAQARQLPHVAVLVADAEAPPAAPGAYDVVLAGLCLFFLPDPAAAVAAWARALRPGGRLALTTFAGDDPRWKPVADATAPFMTGGPDARPSRDPGDRPWDSADALTALLTRTGLRQVTHVEEPHTARFADHDTFWRWSWSHGQRAAWERIPADRFDDARAAATTALDRLTGPDGSLSLRVEVRYTVASR